MATFSESFDKANSDTLGPDLTWVDISGDVDIVSNRARSITTGTTEMLVRADHALDTNDQYAEMKLWLPGLSGVGGGPICRKGANATRTYYMAWLDWNAGSHRLTIYKWVAGTITAIGAAVSGISYSPGDVIRLEVEGTTLRGYVNGSLIATRTDSSITSGVNCGFRMYDNSSSEDYVEVDDFEAGDLVGTPTLTDPGWLVSGNSITPRGTATF